MIDGYPTIFADFDGCLNSDAHASSLGRVDPHTSRGSWVQLHRGEHLPWHLRLDPACVQRLDALVEATSARVVVSSTWREGMTTDWLCEVLQDAGFKGPLCGKTPIVFGRTATLSRRAREIRAWLRSRPKVRRWVVLDDWHDASPAPSRMVQTDGRVGLTDADVAQAAAVLARRR